MVNGKGEVQKKGVRMNNIIWKVQMEKNIYPQRGQAVICIWNEKDGIYEVYYRGRMCGIVLEESARGGFVSGDFLIARVISREGKEMEIMIKGKNARIAVVSTSGADSSFVKCCKAA